MSKIPSPQLPAPSPQSLLQTAVWANFKSRHGWTPHQVADLLFLERTLPLNQRFLYAPEVSLHPRGEGASLTKSEPEDRIGHRSYTPGVKELVERARALGRTRHAFVVRLEFFEEHSDEKAATLAALGLRKSFEDVQPEWRQWIDLRPSETEILAQMKPKGRYNIRLSEKRGVTVAPETDPNVFWDLFTATAARDGFSIRRRDYYDDLIRTLIEVKAGELLVARAVSAGTPISNLQSPISKSITPVSSEVGTPTSYKLQATTSQPPLAAAIISYSPLSDIRHPTSDIRIATYLYGASHSAARDLMAPYALHWAAITRARARGCTIYDLLAVAPPDDIELPASSFQLREKYRGISRFKSQFGGRTVHLLGSWDLVLNPIAYTAFRLLETRRRQ